MSGNKSGQRKVVRLWASHRQQAFLPILTRYVEQSCHFLVDREYGDIALLGGLPEELKAVKPMKLGCLSPPQIHVIIYDGKLVGEGGHRLFGVAFQTPDTFASVALVSTRNLGLHNLEKIDAMLYERLAKEVVHELGHILGLGHCNSPFCVMVGTASVAEVDLKALGFCPTCELELYSFGKRELRRRLAWFLAKIIRSLRRL